MAGWRRQGKMCGVGRRCRQVGMLCDCAPVRTERKWPRDQTRLRQPPALRSALRCAEKSTRRPRATNTEGGLGA